MSAARTSVPPAASTKAAPLRRITLDEALALASSRSPQLQLALEDVRRAEAVLGEVRAQFLPSLTGNLSYTRIDHERRINLRVVQNVQQLSANLTAVVPIIAPSGWARARQAREGVEIRRFDAAEAAREVALAVAHAYLAVIAQHRVIEVDQRALDNARAHYGYAHARYVGGIGNELDDTRAAQDVASSEAVLERAQLGLTQAQEALGVLVGADGPLEAADTLAREAPLSVDSVEDAIERRGDVQGGRGRVQLGRRLVRGTWAEYAPNIWAQFQPFHQNPPTPTMPRFGWSAQLMLSIPLFEGGLRAAERREREVLLVQSRVQLEAVVRQASSEVRVALAAVERADRSLAAAARAAELARKALDMASLAYRAGATTNIEVIDAERRARDADTDVVVAEDAARNARLDLLAATGRLP